MSVTINLAPRHLEIVLDILTKYAPDCEVRLFGSRTTENVKDYSDIDLAIMGRSRMCSEDMQRLREAFEKSELPVRVDVLDWNAISPSFQEVIERQYEILQRGG